MKKRTLALLCAAFMLLAVFPVFPAAAEQGALETGNGGLELDTDPAGGYVGDSTVFPYGSGN